MATLQDDENTQGSNQPATFSRPTGGVAQSNVTPGSGGFVNTQKYIDANKQRAAALNKMVSQGFSSNANEIGQQVNKAQSDFNTAVDAENNRINAGGATGNVAPNTNVTGGLGTPPQYKAPTSNTLAGALKRHGQTNAQPPSAAVQQQLMANNPYAQSKPQKTNDPYYKQIIDKVASGAALTDEEKAAWNKIANAEGADIGFDVSAQQKAAGNLVNRANAYGSEKGRIDELGRTLAGQSTSYGAGSRGLDALITGGDRNARVAALREIQKATQGLPGLVTAAQTGADTALAGLQDKRNELAASATGELSDRIAQQNKIIEDKQKERQQQVETVKQLIADRNFTELAKIPGFENIAASLSGDTYGLNVGADLVGPSSNITKEEVLGSMGLEGQRIARGLTGLEALSGQDVSIGALTNSYDPYAALRTTAGDIKTREALFNKQLADQSKGIVSADTRAENAYNEQLKFATNKEYLSQLNQLEMQKGEPLTPEERSQLAARVQQQVGTQFANNKELIPQLQQKYRDEYNKQIEALRNQIYQKQGWGSPK